MWRPRKSAPAPVRGVAWRWSRALLLVFGVALAAWLAVRLLTPRVRNLTAGELQERMARAASGLPVEEGGLSFERGGLPLETAIQQINQLNADERQEVLSSPAAREYLQRLKPEELATFVQSTLDRGFQVQLQRYRKMSKPERARFLAEVRQRQAESRARLEQAGPEERQRIKQLVASGKLDEILGQAVKAYLGQTTSEERAEMAPLLEAALENVRYAKELP